jgi:hypothetical protein
MRINPYVADINDYTKRDRGAMTDELRRKLWAIVQEMNPTEAQKEALARALGCAGRTR